MSRLCCSQLLDASDKLLPVARLSGSSSRLLQIPVVLPTKYSWPAFFELNAKKHGCIAWQFYVRQRSLTHLICKQYFTKKEGKLEFARDLFAIVCMDSLMETK